MSLAVSLARLEERVNAVLQRMDDRDELQAERDAHFETMLAATVSQAVAAGIKPLTDRVSALEESKRRLVWLGSVIGAAGPTLAWLIQRYGKYLLVLFLVCMQGCTDVPAWTERPVPVYTGPSLPPECDDALERALAYWADHGVDYLVRADTDKVIKYGIIVGHQDLRGNVIGQAELHRDVAVISVEHCGGSVGLQIMAHEFGHALGLDHVDDDTNLMNPYLVGSGSNLGLTEDQLEQVR